ncbi:MAG: substrate-binding domain-containing protein [Treponema sp.]|nr:substrate-binding domain-containing protein [Treponema sp.]
MRKRRQFIAIQLVTIIIVISLFAYSLHYLVLMLRFSIQNNRSISKDYLYHVAVAGEYADITVLRQIQHGAASVSDRYNAVIDNLLPETGAGTTTMQELIDYACAMGVDGIIAYSTNEKINIASPVTVDGNKIPVIMIGSDTPETQAISYIGINGYDTGKQMAEALLSFVQSGKVLAIHDSTTSSTLYSRIISSVQESLSENFYVEDVDVRRRETMSSEDAIRDALRFQIDATAVLCFSETDTVRVAENIVNLNLPRKIIVIGFGDTPQIRNYLDKGILAASLSQQAEVMGASAVQTLLEYIKTGNTNSYITIAARIL